VAWCSLAHLRSAAPRQSTYKDIEHSLERDFPDVYQALLEVARDLVARREHEPQEIEFTFESDAAADLYILQKRPMVHEQQTTPLLRRVVASLRAAARGGHGGVRRSLLRSSGDRARQIDCLLAEAPLTPSFCCARTQSRRTSP